MELNPLKQVDGVTIGSVVVIFTATSFVLRKTFLVPLVEVMEKRNARIKESEEKLKEAERIAAEAERQAEEIIARAKEEADATVKETRAEAEQLVQAQVEAAKEEGERFLEEGRTEIIATQESEQAKLRKEALDCVNAACDKLFGKVEPAVVESVVDKLIARKVH